VVLADPDIEVVEDQWTLVYQGSWADCYTCEVHPTIRRGSSSDGFDWTVSELPALQASEDSEGWDSQETETPSLLFAPEAVYPWLLAYSGAHEDHPWGFPQYAIGLAVSEDGERFERLPADSSLNGNAGQVLTWEEALSDLPDVTGGVVADPELVLSDDGRLHLFYSSFGNDDAGNVLAWGIGHSVSEDGLNWTASPGQPVPSLLGTGGAGGQQPSVTYNATTGLWEMVFTADTDEELVGMPSLFNPCMGVWRATSPDLETWTVDWDTREFAWDPEAAGEEFGWLTGADLFNHRGTRHLFYTSWSDQDVPEDFVVPTQGGYESAVLELRVATRSEE
jgi:hypothetical protein